MRARRWPEVCRKSGLHRSTAHHLLRTLVVLGYLVQDPNSKTYRLGPRVFQLASSTWSEGQMAEIALPFLDELVRKTQETANLAVRKGGFAVMIEKVEGGGPLRVVNSVGSLRPIYCCAIGKVLLAWMAPGMQQEIVASLQFEAHTPNTITGRDKLKKELTRVRNAGFAIDDEEMSLGIRCIAAPVFNFSGQVVAAMGVAGPSVRVTRAKLREFAVPLQGAARQLSERLGHTRQAGKRTGDGAANAGGRVSLAMR